MKGKLSIFKGSQGVTRLFGLLLLPAALLALYRALLVDPNYLAAANVALMQSILLYIGWSNRLNVRQQMVGISLLSYYLSLHILIRLEDLGFASVVAVLASVMLGAGAKNGWIRWFAALPVALLGATAYSLNMLSGSLAALISVTSINALWVVSGLLRSSEKSLLKQMQSSDEAKVRAEYHANRELHLRQERDRALAQLEVEAKRRELVSEGADVSFLEFDYASGRCYGDAAELARHGLAADAQYWEVEQELSRYTAKSQQIVGQQISEMSQKPEGAVASFVLQLHVRPSNELRTFRVSGVNVRVDGALRFSGVSIDITAEQAALEQASLLNDQLELISHTGGLGLIEYFPDTNTFKCNSEVAQRLGIEHTDEERDIALFYAYQTDEVRAVFRTSREEMQASPGGSLQMFTHPFYLANGELRYMRVSRVKRVQQGRVSILGFSVDITKEELAKERAQQHAKELEDANEQIKFRTEYIEKMLDAAPIPVCLLEEDANAGRLTYVNAETLRVLGYTREEMLRENAMDMIFVADADRQYYRSKVVEATNSSTPLREEIQLYRKNKQIGNFEFNCRYERVGGKLFGTLFVLDIDERKAKEQQLLDAVRSSEEAASALAKQRDRQAEMYAVIGHELRTPAASLQMMLDNLEEGETLNSDLVGANIEQLLSVIDTLRAVAQPERMVQSVYVDTQMDETLQQIVENFTPLAQRHGVQLRTDLSGLTIHPVHIQKTLLRQVVSNLVKNAMIHSQGSEVIVGAQGDLIDSRQERLKIWIEDNGKGVPAEKADELFEAFVRGSTEAEGTGLGLHICREIIQAMGGDVRYEPNPAGGSRFVIELDVSVADSSVPVDEQESQSSSFAGLRILLAEDNKTIQMLTQAILTKQGAQVQVCNHGAAALSVFKPGAFDLVLSDIFMPEMNGYEFVAAVREQDRNVKVIGLTAATIGAETDKMLAAGADAVLAKPINIETLKTQLAALESRPV